MNRTNVAFSAEILAELLTGSRYGSFRIIGARFNQADQGHSADTVTFEVEGPPEVVPAAYQSVMLMTSHTGVGGARLTKFDKLEPRR